MVGLVIPTGYSFNLDGTSIYLTMAAVFIAQATNTPMTLTQQLTLLAVLLLTSKGAAGVTGSGFIVLAATLSAVGHVPVAGLALILGIDRFMSEARALTNLIGNGVATLVVAQVDRRPRRGARCAPPRRRDRGRGRRARGGARPDRRRTCPRPPERPTQRWSLRRRGARGRRARDDSAAGALFFAQAQHPPLHLAGRRHRQRVDELDLLRVLVGRELAAHVLLQLVARAPRDGA